MARTITDAVYMTVEAQRENCPDQQLVWVTSHMSGTSRKEWWPRAPKRADEADVMQKPGDEAYMLIFREDDGRTGIVLWAVQPEWTQVELMADVERVKAKVLAYQIGQQQEKN